MPSTTLASLAFSAGTYISAMPFFLAKRAIGKIPCTGRIFPSSANSPAMNLLLESNWICLVAKRKPNAIGRSYMELALGRSAGARLTVILPHWCGGRKPLFLIALETRSRDSLMAASGRPTIVKLCKPLESTSTSTSTISPSKPIVAAEKILEDTFKKY